MKETFKRIFRAAILWVFLGLAWLTFDRQQERPVPGERLDWKEFFQDYIRPALPVAGRFDYPLSPPDGEGSYLQVAYREKSSLGEWWALEKRGPEKEEPVYSLGDGWVTLAEDFQASWRKVVIVAHRLGDAGYPDTAEVLYANLESISVKAGDFVARGQKIGTIESTEDADASRLYLEVREEVGLGLGPGESTDEVGWTQPSRFIRERRGTERSETDKGPAN